MALRKETGIRFFNVAETTKPSPWGEGLGEGGQESNLSFLVLTPALPHLIPQERFLPITLSVGSNGCLNNPASGFSKTRETIHLLLGEKAGMREDKQLTFVFARPHLCPNPCWLLHCSIEVGRDE